MKTVLVLQHVPNEGAGTMLQFLNAKKIPVRMIGLYKGDGLPQDLTSVHSVLIMGGPMNVDEETKYPFLKEEDLFIKKLIQKKIPCLGVCLGAQLIAKALGSKVYKAKQPEVGWADIELLPHSKIDPLFSVIPSPRLRVLQWHEDTFDIPTGAVHLASSAMVPNQAYRYGETVYGFQFHVEVDEAMLKDWFRNAENLSSILAEYRSTQAILTKVTEKIYEKFFNQSGRV